MKILAAIFDLDGTIIESEPVWGKAFVKVLSTFGVQSDESNSHTPGVSVKDNWKNLVSKYEIKTNKTPDELEVMTYLEYEKLIPEIDVRDGVIELITSLKDSGIEIAIATSTSWEIADKILKNLELEYLFDELTTVEEVVNPKPDPEIFIKAVEKMNLEPEDCLVFEDSYTGVKAAKEAGMKVIAIDPSGENEDLENADLVVGNFSEVNPKAISEL